MSGGTADFYAIGTALAAAYANVEPPEGERNIQSSTLPTNNLSSFPAVIVFPPEWEFAYTATRDGEQDWVVRFYRGQMSGDVNKDTTALLKWATVLTRATHAASKLGLAPEVDKAFPASGLIGVHEYGGVEYVVVEQTIRVWTTEPRDWNP